MAKYNSVTSKEDRQILALFIYLLTSLSVFQKLWLFSSPWGQNTGKFPLSFLLQQAACKNVLFTDYLQLWNYFKVSMPDVSKTSLEMLQYKLF